MPKILIRVDKISINLSQLHFMDKDTYFCLDDYPSPTNEKKEQDKEDEFEDENAFGAINGVDFADFSKKSTTKLAPYNPQKKHLTVMGGINLKARCDNPNCMSQKTAKFITWIPLGYGNFELNDMRFDRVCQGCGSEVDPESITNFGFTKAKVVINGRKFDGQKYVKIQPIEFIETEGKFIKFEDSDDKIVKWSSMTIAVKKL